jgi:uncharacterized protein HemX
MSFAYLTYVCLLGLTFATTTTAITDDILGKEGSLALQVALLIAVMALGTVIVTLHRNQNKADQNRYDALMKHHEGFAAEVSRERSYWQDTMVTVVKENTEAMTALRETIRDVTHH